MLVVVNLGKTPTIPKPLSHNTCFVGVRENPFKALLISLLTSLKEMLTIRQKLKMAKYRVNYHKHQLYKMESLIAESKEHTFLKGKNLNETR